MKKFTILHCIFIFFIATLVGCANEPVFETRNDTQLFHDAERALAKGRYIQAVQDFEAIDSLYPFSQYAEQSKKDIIYAYYQSGDLAMAVAAAERFIHVYPRSKYADYAFYMRGVANLEYDRIFTQRYLPIDLSQRDLVTAKKSFADFNELVRRFPNSKYAPDARQRMVYLRNLFAKHEVTVAKHYMRRGAYVAAVNRATDIVSQYGKSPEVKNALLIMIEGYEKLGLKESADEAQRVYDLNYVESGQT